MRQVLRDLGTLTCNSKIQNDLKPGSLSVIHLPIKLGQPRFGSKPWPEVTWDSAWAGRTARGGAAHRFRYRTMRMVDYGACPWPHRGGLWQTAFSIAFLNSEKFWIQKHTGPQGLQIRGVDCAVPVLKVSEHSLPDHSLGNLPQVTSGGRECAAETGSTSRFWLRTHNVVSSCVSDSPGLVSTIHHWK